MAAYKPNAAFFEAYGVEDGSFAESSFFCSHGSNTARQKRTRNTDVWQTRSPASPGLHGSRRSCRVLCEQSVRPRSRACLSGRLGAQIVGGPLFRWKDFSRSARQRGEPQIIQNLYVSVYGALAPCPQTKAGFYRAWGCLGHCRPFQRSPKNAPGLGCPPAYAGGDTRGDSASWPRVFVGVA